MLFIRLLSRFAGAYGLPAFQAWTVSMGKFEFCDRKYLQVPFKAKHKGRDVRV